MVEGTRFAYRLSRLTHPAITVATVIVFLAAWQSLSMPAYILPKPLAIAVKVIADARSGVIFPNLWATFVEVILGFAIAVIVGLVLGAFIALNSYVSSAIYPFVLAFQTVPKVAVAPLFLIWFGFGLDSKIVTAALLALFPILVNVIAGLKNVDERRLLLMRSINAGVWETFWKVRFPSMLPYLFAGLEVAIIFSVIGAVVAEFIGAPIGLGALIVQRQSNIDLPGVFSALIYLSAMGLVLSLIVQFFTRRFLFWTHGASSH